jgi:hypothetical protein
MNNPIKINFAHRQSAHCETGVTANLLHHYGLPCTEAMAFGVGAGLFFGYLPFIKINRLPLTTYRCPVGGIFKRVTRELGIGVSIQKFHHAEEAMNSLDDLLARGIPVGCQTGGYWLPYFPPAFRFHFNMHNLVVFGKEGEEYLISDPVFEEPVRCPRKDLIKARFAQGSLAPKGKMYYLTSIPEKKEFNLPVIRGLRAVCNNMLKVPFPLIGVRGIRFLAGQVEKWPKKLGSREATLYLGQVVRMQEEIGTGGGGFRFMYAAFLQEVATTLHDKRYMELSRKMTLIGDRWRDFAVSGARNCKGRATEKDSYAAMATILRDCAEKEEGLYREMLQCLSR